MRESAWRGRISTRSPACQRIWLPAGAPRRSSQVDSPWLPGLRCSRASRVQVSKGCSVHTGTTLEPASVASRCCQSCSAPRSPLSTSTVSNSGLAPGPGARPAGAGRSRRSAGTGDRPGRAPQSAARPVARPGPAPCVRNRERYRGLAVTEGADHEQGIARLGQLPGIQLAQLLHTHREAGGLQLAGTLPGELLGETALAGEADQPGFAFTALAEAAACGLIARFLRRRSR